MSLPVTIILTIAGYFGLLMAVSAIASRGSDNSTFFTGNRRVPWFVVAFAMMGASISGVTFISVPGMVAEKGYSYLQMVLGFIVGYLLIAFVLVPMFYRRNMISIYGYLEERFGSGSYRTGAWFFFVSKMLGAAVRFFVVCSVLQLLVFGPLGIPFVVNVVATIALIWLYTVQGGVKTLIWTDTLKSFCLVGSVVLCIFFIASDMGYDFWGVTKAIFEHDSSRMFYFDNPKASTYFWKQFIGGIFMAIATTGLDQDMMQRNLACKDSRQSQKNMVVSGITQFFVIALFLLLGTLLLIYLENHSIALPEKSDDIFGMVATSEAMPVWVGILFVLGLIAAAYSAAGSALTSLTTSFTVDILGAHRQEDQRRLTRIRRMVHLGMSVVMGAVIVVFYYLSNQDAISAVYTLASYTYGPILGLFVFGMFTRREVRDRLVPAVCVLAPVLSWCTQWALVRLWGYHTGFELLLINALYTVAGLWLTSPGKAAACQKN
ncbi:MAG: sodium:solute symporter [Muribaculaceae bacterium]|nr:sodium:solute symporter [Muribaculaceae bacterium]MDE5929203.1 sodium:solute symporter [Muribaculaceae bacterium]